MIHSKILMNLLFFGAFEFIQHFMYKKSLEYGICSRTTSEWWKKWIPWHNRFVYSSIKCESSISIQLKHNKETNKTQRCSHHNTQLLISQHYSNDHLYTSILRSRFFPANFSISWMNEWEMIRQWSLSLQNPCSVFFLSSRCCCCFFFYRFAVISL